MVDKIKNRMPVISSDRVNDEPINTSVGFSKEDRKAKAFIKGKEPIQITSVRLKERQWESLKTLSFITKKSLNHCILEAIDKYLEKESVKKILAKNTG